MALLGCSVSPINAGDTLLPFLDSEVSRLLQQSPIETGIELMMGNPGGQSERGISVHALARQSARAQSGRDR
jgi:pyruvate/2-oxoglutarate dehydrogenase complex dihydrolipoamide dehydrogenase (E3) component